MSRPNLKRIFDAKLADKEARIRALEAEVEGLKRELDEVLGLCPNGECKACDHERHKSKAALAHWGRA